MVSGSKAIFTIVTYHSSRGSKRRRVNLLRQRLEKFPKNNLWRIESLKLVDRPDTTRKELAMKLNLKPEAIKYRLKILKKDGRIEHQGSTKSGKWVVLK